MPSFTTLIYLIILAIFSFLFGVKYSEPVKMYSSWIFEDGNQDELPKLSEDMLKQEPQDFDYPEPSTDDSTLQGSESTQAQEVQQ